MATGRASGARVFFYLQYSSVLRGVTLFLVVIEVSDKHT